MFAGAARAAVFSNPDVVRRVNSEFIPVALKAGLVNNPPLGVEGQLYAELNRTKAAPQGICVANSDGKALAWALSFDSDESIVEFLNYAHQRFQADPDASRPVTTERFMKFPGTRMSDIADSGRPPMIPDAHMADDRCPARPALQRGTLVGRIIGRPLDERGDPIPQTLRQEDYMEARFEIPVSVQAQFAGALANAAPGKSIRVPDALARSLVSHAYLGQLDVNPLGGRQTGGRTDSESIEFRATLLRKDDKHQAVYITGKSDVAGGQGDVGVRTDGRMWEHRVQLTWEGYVDITGDQITRLVMTAEGKERLRWGSQRWNLTGEPDVAHLMAGRPIDLDSKVRYGLSAEPCAEDEIGTRVAPNFAAAGNQQLPPEVQQQIRRLREQGRDQQADRLEQMARSRNAGGPQLPLEQRIAHLREAVKHLRAAGVDELADQLSRQIERMEAQQRGDNE